MPPLWGPKKRCRADRSNVAPDPLVDPGNPSYHPQARATPHPARSHHRMVALATRSPSRSKASAPQAKNETVVLVPQRSTNLQLFEAAIKSDTRSHENDNNYFRTGADRGGWRGVFGPRTDERKRYGARRYDLPRGLRLRALDRQAAPESQPSGGFFANSAPVTASHNHIRWVSGRCPAWRGIGGAPVAVSIRTSDLTN
jgi:hypothetical protein